ncbi:hypothetical protein E1573_23895 [Pseudomonas sp. H9]|nr:hypothetical protein E1573_23895 [Pseudomonas sp. H9]
MALVDQLRHQQRQMREHLDLHRRRTEVAERIRAYYQQQGIECDDALVEQGVREFFDRRLMFEAPTLSKTERLIAWLFMRQTQFKHGLIWILILALVIAIKSWTLVADSPSAAQAPAKPQSVQAPKVAGTSTESANMQRYKAQLKRLASMPLPTGLQALMDSYALRVKTIIEKGDPGYVEDVLVEMERQMDFLGNEYLLELVDQPGQQTGFEHCADRALCKASKTAGRKWYLMVQAVDGKGNVGHIPYWREDVQEMRVHTSIAVQVTHEAYLQALKDKHDNGRIDQRDIGYKPAYTMDLAFDERTLDEPLIDEDSPGLNITHSF